MEDALAHWRRLLRVVFGGRRWIVTADVDVPALRQAAHLRTLGADACLAIACTPGVGDRSIADGVELMMLSHDATDWMEGIHASERALNHLTPEARTRIDAFDPDGTARVVGPLFAQEPEVGGRRLLGGRPAAWRRLEDKTVVDALWDAAGVPRAAAEVVPLAEAPAAAARLDRGLGTVWAVDNSRGWHGGARGTRWVRPEDDAAAVASAWTDRAETVRVMPFLDGVPCSIHGIVSADHVAAGRPMEMVILRRSGGNGFFYARAASFWDPSPADRTGMRDFARRVGAHLRETIDYRGFFTIDGVLTADGFRPTELNPRYGAASGLLLGGTPFDLYLLHCIIAEGADVDLRLPELEETLLGLADANRRGRVGGVIDAVCPAEQRRAVVEEADGSWRDAADGETATAQVVWAPFLAGSMVNATFDPEQSPVGPPVGTRLARLLQWLDADWGLGLGTLSGAEDAR